MTAQKPNRPYSQSGLYAAKAALMRFGGSSMGLQLSKSMSSVQDRLARRSNIFFHARQLWMRARFGSNAANLEELDVIRGQGAGRRHGIGMVRSPIL